MWKYLLIFFYVLIISSTGKSQPPISSNYEALKLDKSEKIIEFYKLLQTFYKNQIDYSNYYKRLNSLKKNLDKRTEAVYHMGLSFYHKDNLDSAFFEIRYASNLAESLGENDIIKGIVFAEFAIYLYGMDAHDLAIEYLQKSIPILDKFKTNNLDPTTFNLRNRIIRSYDNLGEKDSALYYMELVIEMGKKFKNKLWVASAINNKGFYLYQQNRLDSALVIFDQAKTFLNLRDTAHIIFYENVNENIAHVLAKKNQLNEAIKLQLNVNNIRIKLNSEILSIIQGFIYLTEYAKQNNQNYIGINEFYKHENYLKSNIGNNISNDKWIRLKRNIAELEGSQKIFLELSIQLMELERVQFEREKVKTRSRAGLNNYIRARNSIFEQQLQIEKLQKTKLAQSLRYRNMMLFSLIALFGLIYYGVHIRNRLRKKLLESEHEKLEQKKKIVDLENENLKIDLELKEKDLSRLVADNKLRTEMKKEFLKKLKQLSIAPDNKIRKELNLLSHEMDNTIDIQDKMNVMQENITEVNRQFEEKLRLAIPKITQSEIEICSLIRLGYDNIQISNIVNKSLANIRVNKFRIKQKANFEDMIAFENMIKGL